MDAEAGQVGAGKVIDPEEIERLEVKVRQIQAEIKLLEAKKKQLSSNIPVSGSKKDITTQSPELAPQAEPLRPTKAAIVARAKTVPDVREKPSTPRVKFVGPTIEIESQMPNAAAVKDELQLKNPMMNFNIVLGNFLCDVC